LKVLADIGAASINKKHDSAKINLCILVSRYLPLDNAVQKYVESFVLASSALP
tara:strand:+ start:689 stop:847 length:159 start_codon:yes stop_codon:yes gene_type:complete